jgi:hypothetical protein
MSILEVRMAAQRAAAAGEVEVGKVVWVVGGRVYRDAGVGR